MPASFLTDANRYKRAVLATMVLKEKERNDTSIVVTPEQLTFSLISERWHIGCLFRSTN